MSSTPSLSVEDEKKLQAGVVEDQPSLPYNQEVPDVDPEMSRRLVRKFDRWLLPLIAIMYLCNNLDKSNLANAKTDHFDKDIHLKGNQYYTIITVFYAPLCIAAVPMMLMIKRFGAYRMLPAMALTFGTLSMCSAAVTKFSDILAIRFFLAISESSCLPGVTFYFSTFYTRGEIASRVGIFFAMASFAGAFGGLIAYGIFQAHNIALKGWQIMFLAEGGLTVVVAFLMFLILPKSPSEARFLTPEEKEAARNRLLKDSSNQLESATDVRGAFRALATPMTLMWIVTVFCVSVPLTSIANFLPQIVARLGYGTVKTNLLTVAPNLVGAVSLAILTMSSDYFRERAIHLFIPVGFMFVGFITLWALDPLKDTAASYFCCFLLGSGVSTPPVLISAWSANNMMDETQRAVLLALIIGFGNTAGLVTSNIFRAKDEPRYTPALAAAAVFSVVGMGLVASLGGWMRWDNRKRNRAQGVNLRSQDVETKILLEGPKNPSFRWMC